jgi:SAM-dependent methyltransferase
MSIDPFQEGSPCTPLSSETLKEAVRSCYDRLAPYYLSYTRPIARERYLAPFHSLKVGARVLDAGCGTGHDSSLLAQLGLKVVATDISPEMCRLARIRLADTKNIEIIEADSGHLNEPEGAFDAILSALEIFHHPNLYDIVQEYARLLVPKGKLVIATNHPVRNMLLRTPPDYFVEDFLWEDWGEHGRVPKFHWSLSTYVAAINSGGLKLDTLDELPPSSDLKDAQDLSISFTGIYPSLAILVCSK